MSDFDLDYLQELSKLHFNEDEKEKFSKDFENILGMINEIANIDVPSDEVRQNAIPLESLREDKSTESMPREDVLQNAPKKKDGCYLTPLVVE